MELHIEFDLNGAPSSGFMSTSENVESDDTGAESGIIPHLVGRLELKGPLVTVTAATLVKLSGDDIPCETSDRLRWPIDRSDAIISF